MEERRPSVDPHTMGMHIKAAYEVLLILTDSGATQQLQEEVRLECGLRQPDSICTIEDIQKSLEKPFQWVAEYAEGIPNMKNWWSDFHVMIYSSDFHEMVENRFAINGRLRQNDVNALVKALVEDIYEVLVGHPFSDDYQNVVESLSKVMGQAISELLSKSLFLLQKEATSNQLSGDQIKLANDIALTLVVPGRLRPSIKQIIKGDEEIITLDKLNQELPKALTWISENSGCDTIWKRKLESKSYNTDWPRTLAIDGKIRRAGIKTAIRECLEDAYQSLIRRPFKTLLDEIHPAITNNLEGAAQIILTKALFFRRDSVFFNESAIQAANNEKKANSPSSSYALSRGTSTHPVTSITAHDIDIWGSRSSTKVAKSPNKKIPQWGLEFNWRHMVQEGKLQELFNTFSTNGYIEKKDMIEIYEHLDPVGLSNAKFEVERVAHGDSICYDEFAILIMKLVQS